MSGVKVGEYSDMHIVTQRHESLNELREIVCQQINLFKQNYHFENIPPELKQRRQWVCWKADIRQNKDGSIKRDAGGLVKVSKPPFDPTTGRMIDKTDQTQWMTFDQAENFYINGAADGIGIVLADGLSGTDLDDCLKPDGTLFEDAQEVMRILGAGYIELSPSGEGFHFLHFGNKPANAGSNRSLPSGGKIEMYDNASAYFTVTGNVYGGVKAVMDITEGINEVCRRYLTKQGGTETAQRPKPCNVPTTEGEGDAQVLDTIQRSSQGARFSSLWSGDTSQYNNDHSSADAALIEMLLFHSQGNEAQTDYLFRQSGLMRDKWDEEHSTDGRTYGQITIQNIKAKHEAEGKYNWKPSMSRPTYSPEKSAQIAEKIEELKVIPFEKEKLSFYYGYILPLLTGLPAVELDQNINTLAAVMKASKISIAKDLKNGSFPAVHQAPNTDSSKLSPAYKEWLACLKGTDYALDSVGNFGYWKKTESGEEIFVPMANFIARPIREIIMDNGQETTLSFEISGLLVFGYPLPTIQVEAGKNVTVDLTEGAGQNELSNYIFLPPAGNMRDAVTTSLSILEIAPPEIVYPLLSMVYPSPLCEAMKRGTGSEPSFFIWLYGQSGCMKSTLAALCLAHFGTFSNKSFPASFKDTALNIEKKGFVLKDSLMVIDDYFPVTNTREAQRMEGIAQSIARGWGDRTGRGRLNADTKIKTAYTPKGMVLVTGEDLPNIGQSGTARMINIEMKPGDLNKPALSALQAQTEKLNQAMRGYIEWLLPQMDGLPKRLKEDFTDLRQRAVDSEQHARLAEAVSWLHIGFRMFIDYAITVNTIDKDQGQFHLDKAWKIFMEAAQVQERNVQEDKPSRKFIEALSELLAIKKVRATPIMQGNSDNEMYCESVGYFDDEFYYLLPQKTYSSIIQFYQEQSTRFPVGEKMLWKHLANEKMILSSQDSPKRQKKINGKNERYIWLYKSVLEIPAQPPVVEHINQPMQGNLYQNPY